MVTFNNSAIQHQPDSSIESSNLEEMERFKLASFKFALQKEGELTNISVRVISKFLGVDSDQLKSPSHILVKTVNDIGFFYVKNKSICKLVSSGAVDFAIVGLDRVIEYDKNSEIEIVKEFNNIASWPLVIATPKNSKITAIDHISTVATQYPILVKAFFEKKKQKVNIIHIEGSSEAMPYMNYYKEKIDAVVDLFVTGKTMKANGLVPWSPSIADIHPVFIANKNVLAQNKTQQFLKKLLN